MTKVKIKKPIPFAFVLDLLAECAPFTKPMFGCTAVYVGDRIVLILREKADAYARDNGVWLATAPEYHASLQEIFPSMRSLELFGADRPTAWQNLPSEALDFEEAVSKACELICKGDERIGKVPQRRKAKRLAKKPMSKKTTAKRPKKSVKKGSPKTSKKRQKVRKSR